MQEMAEQNCFNLGLFRPLNSHSPQTDRIGEAGNQEHEVLWTNGSQWNRNGHRKTFVAKVANLRRRVKTLSDSLCPLTSALGGLRPQQAEHL